jgi:hypothetical protein
VWARESRTQANLHARKSVVVFMANGTGACELHVRYVSDCMRLRFRVVSAFTADFRVYRPPYQTVFFPVHLCATAAVARSRQIAIVTGDRFLFRVFLKELVFLSFLFFFFLKHFLRVLIIRRKFFCFFIEYSFSLKKNLLKSEFF